MMQSEWTSLWEKDIHPALLCLYARRYTIVYSRSRMWDTLRELSWDTAKITMKWLQALNSKWVNKVPCRKHICLYMSKKIRFSRNRGFISSKSMRYECKGNLKRYVSQILNELLWNRFILAEVDNSCDQFLKRRWATLLGNLATDFEKCFFSECGFSLVENTRYQLLDSNITWICCDIALVLEHFYPDGFYQHMSEKLLHHFRSWCY